MYCLKTVSDKLLIYGFTVWRHNASSIPDKGAYLKIIKELFLLSFPNFAFKAYAFGAYKNRFDEIRNQEMTKLNFSYHQMLFTSILAHALSLSVFIAFKRTNSYILLAHSAHR